MWCTLNNRFKSFFGVLPLDSSSLVLPFHTIFNVIWWHWCSALTNCWHFKLKFTSLCLPVPLFLTHTHSRHEQRMFASCSRCGPDLIGAELVWYMKRERERERQGMLGWRTETKHNSFLEEKIDWQRQRESGNPYTDRVIHMQPQMHKAQTEFIHCRLTQHSVIPILQSINRKLSMI